LKKLKLTEKDSLLDDLASGTKIMAAVAKTPWSHTWWYNLRNSDPAFADAWNDAIKQGAMVRLDELETEGRERALKGILEPVGFHQGEPGAWVRRPSDNLLKLFTGAEARRAGDTSYQDKSAEAPLTINIHLDSGFQAFRDCILGALEPYPEAWEAVIGAMGDYVGKSEASAQEAPQGRRQPKTIKGDG
jgi:hypothetical protein